HVKGNLRLHFTKFSRVARPPLFLYFCRLRLFIVAEIDIGLVDPLSSSPPPPTTTPQTLYFRENVDSNDLYASPALEKYKYEQSLEHTSQFIERLEKELEAYREHFARFKKAKENVFDLRKCRLFNKSVFM
ncbi:hypothetical protein V2J09_004500, partial [Rumex salicifolius]